MAKFENLKWQTQNKLRAEYDNRHGNELPDMPEFEPIEQQRRYIIEASYKTDIYVSISQRNSEVSKGHTASTIDGYLRLVSSSEHIEIELKPHTIGQIIDELIKLKNDLDAHNSRVEIYNASLKAYQQAKQTYENRKEDILEKTFANGKYTQDKVDSTIDDIPF